MTLAAIQETKEAETAQSANAIYDPFSGVITLDIKTSRNELFTFDVVEPLDLLQTLSDAVSQRADDLSCISKLP